MTPVTGAVSGAVDLGTAAPDATPVSGFAGLIAALVASPAPAVPDADAARPSATAEPAVATGLIARSQSEDPDPDLDPGDALPTDQSQLIGLPVAISPPLLPLLPLHLLPLLPLDADRVATTVAGTAAATTVMPPPGVEVVENTVNPGPSQGTAGLSRLASLAPAANAAQRPAAVPRPGSGQQTGFTPTPEHRTGSRAVEPTLPRAAADAVLPRPLAPPSPALSAVALATIAPAPAAEPATASALLPVPAAATATPPVASPAAAATLTPQPLAQSLLLQSPPAHGVAAAAPAQLDRRAAGRLRTDLAPAPPVEFASASIPALAVADTGSAPTTRPAPTAAGATDPAPAHLTADITDAANGGFDVATERLGAVRVTLEARDTRVAVQFSTDTPAAGQLLAAHSARLADAVASGGQRLDALAVDVRGGSGGQGGRQAPEQRAQTPGRPAQATPARTARTARTDRFA